MGAHDFIDSSCAEDAATAYEQARQQAQYDYGHDSYNGTISTTSGFKMVPPLEGESREDHYKRILDSTEKWGACACWQDPEDPKRWNFAGWAAS